MCIFGGIKKRFCFIFSGGARGLLLLKKKQNWREV